MAKRPTRLSKASYMNKDDYFRDLHRGGGPDLRDLDSVRSGSGFHAELLKGIWGGSAEEFEKAVEYERIAEQRRRPHIFVRKWRG